MTTAIKKIAAGITATGLAALVSGMVLLAPAHAVLTAAAFGAPAIAVAPARAGDCAPGYVMGVPISDGRLPVKCVPANNIPPGYVDGTGGNALGGIGR
jgi:hypothetical protein